MHSDSLNYWLRYKSWAWPAVYPRDNRLCTHRRCVRCKLVSQKGYTRNKCPSMNSSNWEKSLACCNILGSTAEHLSNPEEVLMFPIRSLATRIVTGHCQPFYRKWKVNAITCSSLPVLFSMLRLHQTWSMPSDAKISTHSDFTLKDFGKETSERKHTKNTA